MIGATWRDLRAILPERSRPAIVALVAESVVAGVLEAGILVLVVSSALAAADDLRRVEVHLPGLDHVAMRPLAALGLALAAGVVTLGLHVHSAWLTSRLSSGALRAARDRTIAAYAKASWARQSLDREGSLQETVSTLAAQSGQLVLQFGNLAATGAGLAALLAAAFVVDPAVTAVVLAFGVALFVLLRPLARLTRTRGRDFVSANTAFAEGTAEWTGLAMDLRVFGVAEREAARLADANRAASATLARSRFVGQVAGGAYRDVATLFLVAAVGVLFLFQGVELDAVGAVVLLVVRSLSYAQTVNATTQGIIEQSPNLELLLERWRSLEASVERFGTTAVDRLGPIELRDVGYDYGPDRPGITGIDLVLAPGEVVGVIGPSGGGKSTLVQVLLRLRPPSRGTLTVDGLPYEQIDPESWHRLVAHVPQEPKLFHGTVADNISFLRPDVTDDDVRRAAAAAHVLDDVERLPDGFATELGPRGIGLSGGQKQRIAIARALAGQPQLLVLDEPTSALDVRSEQLLQATIDEMKGRVTLVIVAHRLTTLSGCDRIVAMAGGRVRTIGTLDQALAEVDFEPVEPVEPS